MRVLILAAGEGSRWRNHFGAPKHFAWLAGEQLIARVVRQVREAGREPWIVVRDVNDTRYHLAKVVQAEQDPYLFSANKVCDSRSYWNKRGRTVVLLGDCWYTTEAMATILGYKRSEWTMFGRPAGSDITGKQWNENFALSFMPRDHDLIFDAGRRTARLRDAGFFRVANHTNFHRAAVGEPDERVGVWDPNPMRFGHFVPIDDWTDDFDSPEEWQSWCLRYAQAPVKPK